MSKEESTPYSFKGDNAKLVDSIKSLLALDSQGALVPNGVCGMARQLLESAADRLTAVEQRNADLVELLTPAQKVIEQFMPSIGKCFNIDFALLNETLIGIGRALKTTESEASQPTTDTGEDE